MTPDQNNTPGKVRQAHRLQKDSTEAPRNRLAVRDRHDRPQAIAARLHHETGALDE
jgi:hypothetical protein